MDHTSFFSVNLCNLCLLRTLLHRSRIFDYTGRNITNPSLTILFCIINLTPDIIHCDKTLHLVILKNLSNYFTILPARIVQNITVLQSYISSLRFRYLITVINLLRRNIADYLLSTVFSLFLISHFTPSIVADSNSLHLCSQINFLQFLPIFSRIGTYISRLCRDRNRIRLCHSSDTLTASIINLKSLCCLIILLIGINRPLIIQNIRRNCRRHHKTGT